MPVKKSNKYDNNRFVDFGPIEVTKPAKPLKATKKKGTKKNAKGK